MSFIKQLESKYGKDLSLGNYIRTIREQREKTQQELADLLGIKSRQYICEVENGKSITLDKVNDICKALKWPSDIAAILWMRENFEAAGMDFEKIIKKQVG